MHRAIPSSKKLLEVIKIHTDVVKLGHDLGSVMQLVTDRTLGLVGADGAAIELAEEDDMVYRATSGIAEAHLGLRLKLKKSFSGLSASSGKVLYCADSETDQHADRAACRRIGLRSMVAIPLRHNKESVGVLKAMSTQVDGFTAEDIELLRLISDLVGSAMYFSTHFDDSDLYHKATHDPLTNLANRALFMDRLRKSAALCTRTDSSLGLIVIDMDDLKQINDTYGHLVGDKFIKELAKRSLAIARTTDTVARLGGDEFAVILTPVDADVGVEHFVERLKSTLQQPITLNGKQYPLKASIGASSYQEDTQNLDSLIELADMRMYKNKTDRKNPD